QWINGLTTEQLSSFHALAAQLNEYKQQLVTAGITENERFLSRTNAWKPILSILKMVILFPAALLGALHAGWIYLLVKRWVETTFKRPVFWGSTKKVMSVFAVGLLNLPCLFLMPIFLPWTFQVNLGISIMYFLAIGLFAQAFLALIKEWTFLKRYNHVKAINMDGLNQSHAAILEKINAFIPSL
ncbi:MAG: hypothetical protein ACKO4Y_08620, partial [Flavobacteriales bacterium]